jgi:excisionase family DNA binding protein
MKKIEVKTPEPEQALLTVKQACQRLQIGRTLCYGMCQAGLLHPVQIGSRGVRIPNSEIERFIREQRRS